MLNGSNEGRKGLFWLAVAMLSCAVLGRRGVWLLLFSSQQNGKQRCQAGNGTDSVTAKDLPSMTHFLQLVPMSQGSMLPKIALLSGEYTFKH